jgi:hypothetical protein
MLGLPSMMLTENDIFTHTHTHTQTPKNVPYMELIIMTTRKVIMRKININPEFAESLAMKII